MAWAGEWRHAVVSLVVLELPLRPCIPSVVWPGTRSIFVPQLVRHNKNLYQTPKLQVSAVRSCPSSLDLRRAGAPTALWATKVQSSIPEVDAHSTIADLSEFWTKVRFRLPAVLTWGCQKSDQGARLSRSQAKCLTSGSSQVLTAVVKANFFLKGCYPDFWWCRCGLWMKALMHRPRLRICVPS